MVIGLPSWWYEPEVATVSCERGHTFLLAAVMQIEKPVSVGWRDRYQCPLDGTELELVPPL